MGFLEGVSMEYLRANVITVKFIVRGLLRDAGAFTLVIRTSSL